MVTNTGTAADNLKENGDCTKENKTESNLEYANIKPTSEEAPKSGQNEIVQNQKDASKMSSQADTNPTQNTNGIAPPGSGYNNRGYGNGIMPPAQPNGPQYGDTNSTTPYQPYGAYNHTNSIYPVSKPGSRPMQSGPVGSHHPMQRYPNQQQGGHTPTLNQLLTTPTRYPASYAGHNSTPGSNVAGQPSEYGSNNWQTRPQHQQQYGREVVDPSMNPESGGYPPQSQYHPQQPNFRSPSNYPPPPGSQYNHNPQYNPSMPPTSASSGYPPGSYPSRHPNYPGYPSQYGQQGPYHRGPYPPQQHGYPPNSGYMAGNPSQPPTMEENKTYMQQTLDQQASKLQGEVPSSNPNLMSPNRKTPQPQPSQNSSVQSPHATPSPRHGQPTHPSVVQLRGPSPAPSSPHNTPMSPPVRPGTPQQSHRPGSEHSEHSSMSSQSPMPGYPNYRPHQPQPGYGPGQSPHYQQHMMSQQQQQQQMYSQNNPQYATVGHPQRPGPPSGGKPGIPMPQQHPGYNNQQQQQQQQPSVSGYQQQPGMYGHQYDANYQYQQPMQGYNTASPAPTERRPSRQGSQPSAATQPVDNTRPGAAAAAAAAIAAAAHSAQPGSSPGSKPAQATATSYYPTPQGPREPAPPRMPQQSPTAYPQPYARMPHQAGNVPPGQRMMGPVGGSPMQRMPPPGSHYPGNYPQQGHMPHGQYPGHYPQHSMDPNHPPPGMHYGHYPPHHEQHPHPPEEPPKSKASARSASQKLAALYEPAQEPGRKEFIDAVLHYWEEKSLPLKNAPLMGRKTLDLYRLYQLVKGRGFMQEVTNNKKWPDISSIMNLGTSSTSGFTLKKQYCKYLYGFECKRERGEAEPQEAMARITEANRKKKILTDQQAAKSEVKAPSSQPGTPQTPTQIPPNSSPAVPSPGQLRYPSQQYPTQEGQYPQQMAQYGPGYMQHQQPNRHYPMPGHPGYPQMQQPGQYAPPSGAGYPHPHNMASPHPGANLPSESPSRKTPDINRHPDTPGSVKSADFKDRKSHSRPGTPKVMKPPVPMPSAPSTTNPYTDPSKNQPSTHPTASPAYRPPPMHPSHQYRQYPPRPQMPPHRPGYPYHPQAYPNNASQHNRMPGGGIMGTSTYQNVARPPHSQSPYSQYPGMKRHSNDPYGPPRKQHIADGHPGQFPPNHPTYRGEHDAMVRHRYPPSSTVNASNHNNPPTQSGAFPMKRITKGYPRRPMHVASPGLSPRFTHPKSGSPGIVDGKRQIHMIRSPYSFPRNSVEATQIKSGKFVKKSCKDVGSIEAWRVIMALKSGLLAESTWALNALTILLYDQQTVSQLKLSQLPGLLDAVVEHYRTCLGRLFSLRKEKAVLGVNFMNEELLSSQKINEDVFHQDDLIDPKELKSRMRMRNCRSKMCSKFTKYSIKFDGRVDNYPQDRVDQWDLSNKINLADDLAHIVVCFSQKENSQSKTSKLDDEEIPANQDDSIVVVEATLEDVLNIPCSILSPDDFEVMDIGADLIKRTDNTDSDVITENKTDQSDSNITLNKRDSEDEKSPEVSNELTNGELKSKSAKNDIIDKLNDLTNKSNEIITDKAFKTPCDVMKQSLRKEVLCNGLMTGSLNKESDVSEEEGKAQNSDKNLPKNVEEKMECAGNGKDSCKQNGVADVEENGGGSCKENGVKDGGELKKEPENAPEESVTRKVEKILEERNVILLEDEAAGSCNSINDILTAPILCHKLCPTRQEIADRVQCISNIIRGFSFVPQNSGEICKQKHLMKAISGSLLLRHKHRTRQRKNMKSDEAGSLADCCDLKSSGFEGESKTKYYLKSLDFASKKTVTSNNLFAPKEQKNRADRRSCRFSATVLEEDDSEAEEIYSDPWWWDCVYRLHEDSLITLSNISVTLDLCELTDDHAALSIIEACLHWSVCPSSAACDSFSTKPRHPLSPQRLALDILTKLSIKDQNVDLILAIRPYSRLEKLFILLVNLICDRRDQTLREFAIVLLCNLASADFTVARSVALQKGAISGIINFLEECEETGVSNRRMFSAGQQIVNCGTPPFMMIKCAMILLSIAKVPENKPSFMKHQLRLLSLSMSQLLGNSVAKIISSLLFEISHEAL